MGFFKELGKKLGFIEEDKTAQIKEERSKIVSGISEKLKMLNFTDEEINEVTSILKKMEADVQIEKNALIGTNINNPDPTIIMKEKMDKIREIELKAAEDMRTKIAEIKKRKELQ